MRTHPVPTAYAPRRLCGAAALLLWIPVLCQAQQAAAPSAAAQQASTPAPPADEIVTLSPFETTADSVNGYQASTTTTATHMNESLADIPNTITVLDAELLKDVNATDLFGAVNYALSAQNTYSVGQGTVGKQNGSLFGNDIQFRGIDTLRQLRDGAPWYLDSDSFNTDRIEFSTGPSGLTYGDVDPGGTINIVTKRANFTPAGSFEVLYDTFDSRRMTLDINQPIISDTLSVRLNLVDSREDTQIQRRENTLDGIAGAATYVPFKDGKTKIEVSYEDGSGVDYLGEDPLEEEFDAYAPGSGTDALTVNGVKGVTNGVGMAEFSAAPTAAAPNHVFVDIDGQDYDMDATANNVFRYSEVLTTKAVATGADPNNPLLLLRGSVPDSIVPYDQDWAGPDNRQEQQYHVLTYDLTHEFTDDLSVMFTHTQEYDKTFSMETFNDDDAFGGTQVDHALFEDVTPDLPGTNGTLIPNPHYQQYYVTYTPEKTYLTHESTYERGDLFYNLRLPWGITEKLIGSSSYRYDRTGSDNYAYALSQPYIASLGYTGAAASFLNNMVYPVHYLSEGNSDAALQVDEGPNYAWFRNDTTTNNRFESSLWSTDLSALGTYFGDRLHTSVGASRDYYVEYKMEPMITDSLGQLQFVDNNNNVITSGVVPVYPIWRQYATNETYGAVFKVLPWLSLTGGYFESSLFADRPNSYALALLGNKPVGPEQGEGDDYGLRFDFLQDKLYATVTYYKTVATNEYQSVSAATITELNGILSPSGPPAITGSEDSEDQTAYGMEMEVVGNPTRNWTMRATFSDGYTNLTDFYPRLTALISQAEAVVTAEGQNPNTATATAQTFIENNATNTFVRQVDASFATRYAFTEGPLKGFLAGTSFEFQRGRLITAQLDVGGIQVLNPYGTPDQYYVNPFVAYAYKIGKETVEFRVMANNVFNEVTNQGNNINDPRFTTPRDVTFSATVKY